MSGEAAPLQFMQTLPAEEAARAHFYALIATLFYAAPDERLLNTLGVISNQVGQFLQRRQAERVLRESEARFRALTELSSDFFWETDALHRLAQASHGPNHKAVLGKTTGHARWDIPSTYPDAAAWASQVGNQKLFTSRFIW